MYMEIFSVINILLCFHFQDDFVDTLNLLWRYYEKNREYYPAAKILERLAEKPGSVYHKNLTGENVTNFSDS